MYFRRRKQIAKENKTRAKIDEKLQNFKELNGETFFRKTLRELSFKKKNEKREKLSFHQKRICQ